MPAHARHRVSRVVFTQTESFVSTGGGYEYSARIQDHLKSNGAERLQPIQRHLTAQMSDIGIIVQYTSLSN